VKSRISRPIRLTNRLITTKSPIKPFAKLTHALHDRVKWLGGCEALCTSLDVVGLYWMTADNIFRLLIKSDLLHCKLLLQFVVQNSIVRSMHLPRSNSTVHYYRFRCIYPTPASLLVLLSNCPLQVIYSVHNNC